MKRSPALRLVQREAAKAARARASLESSIRAAHQQGESLRSIADACGWSHEQVRRIVQQ